MNFFEDILGFAPFESKFFVKEHERDYYIKLHEIEYVEWIESLDKDE